MFQFKPRTFKIPFNVGEITICRKVYHKTPFGIIRKDELDDAEALYLLLYDMINDGGPKNYQEARNLFSNPKNFLEKNNKNKQTTKG